jgi:hypothetical protein
MVVERGRGRAERGSDTGEPSLRDREVELALDEERDCARVNGRAGV